MNFKTFFDLVPPNRNKKAGRFAAPLFRTHAKPFLSFSWLFRLAALKVRRFLEFDRRAFWERYRASVAPRRGLLWLQRKALAKFCAPKSLSTCVFAAMESRSRHRGSAGSFGKMSEPALGNWFQFAAQKSGLRFASTDLQELFMAQVGLGSVPDSAPILKTCETHLAEWIDALLKLENSPFSAPNWWSHRCPNFPELSSRMLCVPNLQKLFLPSHSSQ